MKNEHFKKLISGITVKTLFLTWLAVGQLYSTCAYSAAPSKEILILKSSDAAIYSETSDAIKRLLPENCRKECTKQEKYNIRVFSVDKTSRETIKKTDYAFVITLGTKAKEFIEEAQLSDESRQLHALLPLAEYHHRDTRDHHYLVLDQPPGKMLLAIKQLTNSEKPVGILYSDSSEWRISLIEQSANKLNIKILPTRIEEQDHSNIGMSLNGLLAKVSSILIVPDKTIYNRSTIAQMLLTGYQKNIPFFGYSKALTKTGALASSTTDKKLIAGEIVRLAIRILDGQAVEKISYPEKNKLVINGRILESLNLSVPREIPGADITEVIE